MTSTEVAPHRSSSRSPAAAAPGGWAPAQWMSSINTTTGRRAERISRNRRTAQMISVTAKAASVRPIAPSSRSATGPPSSPSSAESLLRASPSPSTSAIPAASRIGFRDREVGDAAPVRETPPLQRDGPVLAAAEELGEQARFPDAGGAERRDDPWTPRVRTCLQERCLENLQLRLPPHERRIRTAARRLRRHDSDEPIGSDALRLALEPEGFDGDDFDRVTRSIGRWTHRSARRRPAPPAPASPPCSPCRP